MVTISVNSAASPSANGSSETHSKRSREERNKRAANRRPKSSINSLVFNPFFVLLFGLLAVSCLISFFLVFSHPEGAWGNTASTSAQQGGNSGGIKLRHKSKAERDALMPDDDDDDKEELAHKQNQNAQRHAEEAAGGDVDDDGDDDSNKEVKAEAKVVAKVVSVKKYAEKYAAYDVELTPIFEDIKPFDTTLETPHLLPMPPILPVFAEVENGDKLIDDLLHHNKPTMAGIVAFFTKYLERLHDQNKKLSKQEGRDVTGENIHEMLLVDSYFDLTKEVIDPFEDAYRGRTIFPVRDDESVFISLAAFREHLLAQTLMSAFDRAKDPNKLFVGAVVQNCFGLDGVVCKTGMQVVGKYPNGQDRTSVSPAPPDSNGIEVFCTDEKYKHYCDNGQVRVLYVHDTDALGPQTARFYASKLWGGETYYMQMDAHLEFAPDWEQYYIDEARLSKNFPKSVLSAYPPGFKAFDGEFKGGSRGERLCGAHFSKSSVESQILRIEQLGLTPWDAEFPTQIPFIAAGFFFAHSDFLRDVPFDPYAPWCFMGEEIALSIRAWTNGWNIYAPRKNVIAHQYRPGRLGLPKFWESVGRDSGRGSLNTRLQKHVLRRVKHMLAYTDDSREKIEKEGDGVCLHHFEYYSLGHTRPLEDYLQWTHINPAKQETSKIEWCLAAATP